MFRAVVMVWFGLVSCSAALAQGCRDDVVFLKNDQTEIRFSIELAQTPEERAKGLMYRESMPRMSGMLFVFEHPQRVAFWMKNTLLPLDLIFLDKTGRVSRVHSNAIPHDETPIPGGDQVYAVLEINGGLAESFLIAPGTLMRHKIFSSGPAAWPC